MQNCDEMKEEFNNIINMVKDKAYFADFSETKIACEFLAERLEKFKEKYL